MLKAAQELSEAWVAEKQVHEEAVPVEDGVLTAYVEVTDAVLGT